MLEDFTATQQLLFTATLDGNDVRFLGLVALPTLRRSLAKEYPDLERIYRSIYSSILADAIGLRRPRGTQQGTNYTDFMVDFLTRNFPSSLAQTQSSALRERVTSSFLEQLLGQSLVKNTVAFAKEISQIKKDVLLSIIITNTDRELTTTPLESAVRFFVIVEGKQLIVVDVLELAVHIADTTLQTTGKK